MSIVSARSLSKAYGARSLFEGISLTVEPGDRVGLLGMNGTGKSTLLRVIAGIEPSDAGVVDRQRDASILYLSQEPELEADRTPREIVQAGLKEWHAATSAYEALSKRIDAGGATPAVLDEQAHFAEAIERLGGLGAGARGGRHARQARCP